MTPWLQQLHVRLKSGDVPQDFPGIKSTKAPGKLVFNRQKQLVNHCSLEFDLRQAYARLLIYHPGTLELLCDAIAARES